MSKKVGVVLFVVYFLIGAYLVVRSLDLFSLPDFLVNIDKWVTFVGGLLVLLGGINHFRIRRRKLKDQVLSTK